jgi:hypothetical protein
MGGSVGRCVRAAGVWAKAAGEYPSAAVGYEMRYGPWIVYNHRVRVCERSATPRSARRAPLVARQSALVEHHSGWSDTTGLDDPCKRLICSTLAITQYKRSHIEWGFTLLECILTRQNRRQGGRGSSRSWRRRRGRIRPLRFFCANWPACALALHLQLALPLRVLPLCRSCGSMAACVHVVPLGAIDEFCGDLVERVPG